MNFHLLQMQFQPCTYCFGYRIRTYVCMENRNETKYVVDLIDSSTFVVMSGNVVGETFVYVLNFFDLK